MWPFALAIVIFIIGYTWIQLEFRKEGPTNQPYQDLLDRQKAVVEKNMYDWYSLKAEVATKETPLSSEGIEIKTAEGPLENFLPQQLVYYIASRPILIPKIERVEREETAQAASHYNLKLWLPRGMAEDQRFRLSAFYKEGELHLLAQFLVQKREHSEDLLNEDFTPYLFSIPTDPMTTESLSVYLYTEGEIRSWKAIVEQTEPA